MGMRVDAAGDDKGMCRGRHRVTRQVRSDFGDDLAFDADVGGIAAVGGNDGAILMTVLMALFLCGLKAAMAGELIGLSGHDRGQRAGAP